VLALSAVSAWCCVVQDTRRRVWRLASGVPGSASLSLRPSVAVLDAAAFLRRSDAPNLQHTASMFRALEASPRVFLMDTFASAAVRTLHVARLPLLWD